MKNKDDVFENKKYKMWTMKESCLRIGALEVLAKPSRMANTLFYPAGHIEYAPHVKKTVRA